MVGKRIRRKAYLAAKTRNQLRGRVVDVETDSCPDTPRRAAELVILYDMRPGKVRTPARWMLNPTCRRNFITMNFKNIVREATTALRRNWVRSEIGRAKERRTRWI